MSHEKLIAHLNALRNCFATHPVVMKMSSDAALAVKPILLESAKFNVLEQSQFLNVATLIGLIINRTSEGQDLISDDKRKLIYKALEEIIKLFRQADIEIQSKLRFDYHPLTFFAKPSENTVQTTAKSYCSFQFLIDVDGTLSTMIAPYTNITLCQLLLECKDRLPQSNFHLFTRRSKREMASHLLDAFKNKVPLKKITTGHVIERLQQHGLPISIISTEVDVACEIPGGYYENALKGYEKELVEILNGEKDLVSAQGLIDFYYSHVLRNEKEVLTEHNNYGKVLQFQQMYNHLIKENPNAVFIVIDDWTVNLDAIAGWIEGNPCNLILIRATASKTIEHYRNELSAGLKKFGVNVDFESILPASRLASCTVK